jgi:hypothetical protein
MTDGVLSTSGSGFSAQILKTQHEVSALKKTREVQEQQGEGALKLIESAKQTGSTPDTASRLGQNINVKV